MSKPSQVIVVLEDDHHKMLVYRYLINRGLNNHSIRIERSPSGEGSAESWVRTRFIKEVKVYRGRQARASTALIVVIDADAHGVQEKFTQLDQALKNGGITAVDGDEQIARLVPKRNVETWILCLNGQPVDEGTDYKWERHDWNELIHPASETLSLWARQRVEPPNHCIDSLRTGIRELNRLRI